MKSFEDFAKHHYQIAVAGSEADPVFRVLTDGQFGEVIAKLDESEVRKPVEEAIASLKKGDSLDVAYLQRLIGENPINQEVVDLIESFGAPFGYELKESEVVG